MYVYVSWAYTDKAETAYLDRTELIAKFTKPEGMTDEDKQQVAELDAAACAPEYVDFHTALEKTPYDFAAMPLDDANRNLLAVRFVVPALGKLAAFQLSKRMPGNDKQLVSLAARAFLLNTFSGEWTGKPNGTNPHKITFVGLTGLTTFMTDLAVACGALDAPLPVDCWRTSIQIELPADNIVKQLMNACAFTVRDNAAETVKYQKLVSGWAGSGVSAERDSALLLSAAFKLGLKDA